MQAGHQVVKKFNKTILSFVSFKIILSWFKDIFICELLKSYNINYTVTNSSEAFDLAKSLGGIKAIPTIFLIDKHGTFFQKYTGLVPNEMLEVDIKKLLER